MPTLADDRSDRRARRLPPRRRRARRHGGSRTPCARTPAIRSESSAVAPTETDAIARLTAWLRLADRARGGARRPADRGARVSSDGRRQRVRESRRGTTALELQKESLDAEADDRLDAVRAADDSGVEASKPLT